MPPPPRCNCSLCRRKGALMKPAVRGAGRLTITQGEDRAHAVLTQEAYSKGYLKPDEFQAVARKMIQTVVKGERVVAKGCA